MKKSIAIGVITYHPSTNLTIRLKSLMDMGYSVYIFDNSPEDDLIRRFSREFGNDTIKYLTCGKNVGLGIGLSSIGAQAYYDAHSALFFFDQDTVFSSRTLEFVERFLEKYPNVASSYSAVVFNAKKSDDVGVNDEYAFHDVLLAISSGSLFFLENLKKLNWHNEKYFVDYVDYEFCLNSNNKNFKIGECSTTPGFDHESEQADVTYHVFGKTMRLRRYSPSRMFDATSASFRLMIASIKAGNLRLFYAITRSFALYVYFQILARFVKYFRFEKESMK